VTPVKGYSILRGYQSQSYIMTDGQSASLFWCQAPIWDPRPIFPLLLLRVCWCGALSLWREAWSIVSSDLSPTGLMNIFYCLYFWDSANLEGQVPVFISPRNRVAQLYSQALGSRWYQKVKVNVILRPTVGCPVPLVVGNHLGPAANFSLSLEFSLDSCGFVIL
jgi:hypothetical protein